MKQFKITHFEDDPFLGKMYKSKFKETNINYKVYTNPPGLEGDLIDLIEKERPDLIIMDIIMPVMDGYKATEILKSNPKTTNIPIIGLCNMGQKDEILKAINLGMIDYFVTSTLTPSEIVNNVMDFLNDPKKYKIKYKQFLFKISSSFKETQNSHIKYKQILDSGPPIDFLSKKSSEKFLENSFKNKCHTLYSDLLNKDYYEIYLILQNAGWITAGEYYNAHICEFELQQTKFWNDYFYQKYKSVFFELYPEVKNEKKAQKEPEKSLIDNAKMTIALLECIKRNGFFYIYDNSIYFIDIMTTNLRNLLNGGTKFEYLIAYGVKFEKFNLKDLPPLIQRLIDNYVNSTKTINLLSKKNKKLKKIAVFVSFLIIFIIGIIILNVF